MKKLTERTIEVGVFYYLKIILQIMMLAYILGCIFILKEDVGTLLEDGMFTIFVIAEVIANIMAKTSEEVVVKNHNGKVIDILGELKYKTPKAKIRIVISIILIGVMYYIYKFANSNILSYANLFILLSDSFKSIYENFVMYISKKPKAPPSINDYSKLILDALGDEFAKHNVDANLNKVVIKKRQPKVKFEFNIDYVSLEAHLKLNSSNTSELTEEQCDFLTKNVFAVYGFHLILDRGTNTEEHS